ncbi:hypothetical protein RZS08_45915, partial [Arthrospira platensis SPKY1]|nr:hypothetical protein [Arthrospira platensis SPKY1]
MNRRYIPYLIAQTGIEEILAAIRRNKSAELIRLFPFHTPSIEPALSTALESVWRQNGQRLSEILAAHGSQAFLNELIRSALSILIGSTRQTDSG